MSYCFPVFDSVALIFEKKKKGELKSDMTVVTVKITRGP